MLDPIPTQALLKCGIDFIHKAIKLPRLIPGWETNADNVGTSIDVRLNCLDALLRASHRHSHV